VPQFPAEVKCTAAKDTGWISTTWTQIGSGTVTAPAGGEYKLEITNPEHGDLRVLLSVDSLENFLPAGPPPAPAKGKKPAAAKAAGPLLVAATFNPSKEGHAVVIGLEWPAFKAKVDKMAALGLKLVTIKVFDEGGKKLWAGIFKNVPDRVVLRANEEWKDFKVDWARMTGGLARLVDVEVYDTKPYYAGLFRDFSDRNRPMMWTDERKNFAEKVKDLAIEGQQLIDFEVYVGPTKTTYVGTFRATSGKYELWTGNDKAAFEKKWKDASGKGLQLVEVIPYKENKKLAFDGIVRGGVGSPGDALLDADVATFVKRWLDDTGKGLRLTSIAPYHE
jgi:polyglycine hydrolase-like protein